MKFKNNLINEEPQYLGEQNTTKSEKFISPIG